jgi:hypothetical protein
MKKIPLSQNQVALVDDELFEWLSQWKWCAAWAPTNKSYYAVRSQWNGSGFDRFKMHRVITDAPKNLLVDHLDKNTLNNTRANLRLCGRSGNAENMSITSRNTTGYRGVSPVKSRGTFIANIRINKKSKFLGSYRCPTSAALAYDRYAKEHGGPHWRLNFPPLGKNAA